jgi:hypothetical protein
LSWFHALKPVAYKLIASSDGDESNGSCMVND